MRFHGMEEVVSSNLTRSTNPPISAMQPAPPLAQHRTDSLTRGRGQFHRPDALEVGKVSLYVNIR
jgi:hypothetical protein